MAEHAAPTSVTIAATEEETLLSRFVKRYWIAFAGLAVVITAGILIKQFRDEAAQEARASSWDPLAAQVEFGDLPGENGLPNSMPLTLPEAGVLAGLSGELEDGPAGPWAKALQVGRLLQDGDEAGAVQAAQALAQTWPDHPLARMELPFDPDGSPKSLAAHLAERVAEVEAWEAAHRELFENPALPEGSPRVTLNTSQGAITVGLYATQAPLHAENFMTRAEAGSYDGTKFHRVEPGRTVYAGDPNSIEGEPETWGLGGGEETLEQEGNDLHHFAHVLGMDRAVGSTDSSTALFYITLSEQFQRDAQNTAFGVVLEGQDVLEAIASGPLDGLRPQDPITIESVTVQR